MVLPGSPARPGALRCSSLCMGTPSFPSCRDTSALTCRHPSEKHLSHSSRERWARPPCALTGCPGVSLLARPLQLCRYTHLSTWRPHTSTVTRSPPTPPRPSCLAHSRCSTNACGVNAWKCQGSRALNLSPRSGGSTDTGARVSAQRVVPEHPPRATGRTALPGTGSVPSVALQAWPPEQAGAAWLPFLESPLFRRQKAGSLELTLQGGISVAGLGC